MKRLVYLSMAIVVVIGLLPAAAAVAAPPAPESRPGHERPGDRSEDGGAPGRVNRPGRSRGMPASVPGDERWADFFGGQGPDGVVYALAADGSGHVYVGGEFTLIGDLPVNYVAVWDSTTNTWSALGSGVDGRVQPLAVDGSARLYAGGYFSNAGGVAAASIAMWDGTEWHALGSGMSGGDYPVVNAMAFDNSGNLYAGGDFTTAGGVTANRVAMWDGTDWSALGNGIGGGSWEATKALAIDGSGHLYAGGYFTNSWTQRVQAVWAWSGSAWSPLGSGEDESATDLAIDGSGNLYASGYLTKAGGTKANGVFVWDGSAWSTLGGAPTYVNALEFDASDHLVAGGRFTSPASNVALWNGSTWSALGSGVDDNVYALAVRDSNLYAGGYFQAAGGSVATRVARWDGSAWSALGSDWSHHGGGLGMGSSVDALVADGSGNLYAGGDFVTAGDVVVNYVAKWDGSAWSALGSGMAGGDFTSVRALAVDSHGNLYAGGEFTSAGGVAANRVAKWDGSSWSALGSGMDDIVYALAVDGSDNLYAVGWFTTAGGLSVNRVAKWDGSAWSALSGGLGDDWYDMIYAVAVDGSGKVYAGGRFRWPANRVAVWDGTAWSALGAGIGDPGYEYHEVDALAFDASGKLYAAGYFPVAGGQPANNVAVWDGSAWSALGSGVGIPADEDEVYALAVGGCRDVYAGGYFISAGGVTATGIARWDGSAWSALGSGFEEWYDAFALAADGAGHLFAGGWFPTAGGKPSANTARWDMTWSEYDAAFTWDPVQPLAGQQVTFTGTAQGSEPIHYAWQFDTKGLGAEGRTEGSNQEVHVYDAPGDYLVSM